MKSFLLLVLSLMAGCETSSDKKRCTETWAECDYPQESRKYQRIDVIHPKHAKDGERITETDVWENKGRFFLYHDTKEKELRVVFTQLQRDIKAFQCRFYQTPDSKPETKELKAEDCETQTQLNYSTYTTAKTTITCGDSGNHQSSVQFFCKQNGSTCENILSSQSSLQSNKRFTLTNSGFSISISDVSSQDEGVYWCGVKSNGANYRAALRKIQLKVQNITVIEKSSSVGQTLTHWCSYSTNPPIKKIICKGEDPSECQRLVNTDQRNTGRFSIKDDTQKRNITMTVRNLTTDDTGTYWCGAENTDRRSNLFFNKLVLTVVYPNTSTTSTSTSAPSVQSTTASAETKTASATTSGPSHNSTTTSAQGGSQKTAVTAAVVCAALLVLVLILVCKSSKNKRNRGAQVNREDHVYAETQEPPQKPDSGTAMKTIYVTANFPTNPSDLLQYSTVKLQNTDIYSPVRDNGQRSSYSAVKHTSELTEDPLYATVNLPQQD